MAIAAVFTLIALPAIWLFTRSEANSGSVAPTIAAVGVDSPAAGQSTERAANDNAMGTNSPIFIDGPETPPPAAVNQIVVPAEIPGEFVEGRATYKSTTSTDLDTCSAPHAPFGAELTVTNRDNGRITTCINRAPIGLSAGLELQLTAQQFAKLAQLVDAPIPVRITWNGSK
ncbi:MAG: hypothetical protein ABIR32_16595 [Ilumatobacteraceae bacterium]